MITITSLQNRVKEFASRKGKFSIGLSEFFSFLGDIILKLRDIISGTAISMIFQPNVANLAALNAITNPQKGWACKVLDQLDEYGNSYIYQYDGTQWNKTPFTVFPSDAATKGELVDHVDNKKVHFEELQNNPNIDNIDDGKYIYKTSSISPIPTSSTWIVFQTTSAKGGVVIPTQYKLGYNGFFERVKENNIWSGWKEIGANVDLSGLATIDDLTTHINNGNVHFKELLHNADLDNLDDGIYRGNSSAVSNNPKYYTLFQYSSWAIFGSSKTKLSSIQFRFNSSGFLKRETAAILGQGIVWNEWEQVDKAPIDYANINGEPTGEIYNGKPVYAKMIKFNMEALRKDIDTELHGLEIEDIWLELNLCRGKVGDGIVFSLFAGKITGLEDVISSDVQFSWLLKNMYNPIIKEGNWNIYIDNNNDWPEEIEMPCQILVKYTLK